jgi:hypothetical protein
MMTYGRYWAGILKMMKVMGSFQESRVQVVMKERARAEAKMCPEVMRRFRSCVVVRLLELFATFWKQCDGREVYMAEGLWERGCLPRDHAQGLARRYEAAIELCENRKNLPR